MSEILRDHFGNQDFIEEAAATRDVQARVGGANAVSTGVSDKAKSSLRMLYEAQADVIRRQTGDLEEVRQKLGLSQRKISQLLMVDPSAWTRWAKSKAPPHIYRSLQWYMTIQEKIPGLTPQYFIGKDPEVFHQKTLKRIEEIEEANQRLQRENEQFQLKVFNLENAVRANRAGFFMMGLAAVIMAFAMYWRFLR